MGWVAKRVQEIEQEPTYVDGSSTICFETTLQPLNIAAAWTSRSAPLCVRIACEPEVTGSSVGFVPTNALVVIY